MSGFHLNLPITFETNVKITNEDTGEVLVDKSNAIHSQNMARIIARALAGEDNSIFSRLALGNGGTLRDASDNVIFKLPNDGTKGDGWESRLYNETYSEIIDEDNPAFKTDIGSADANNVRIGGGSSPNDDPAGVGVVSQEVGTKSNIVVTMFLNANEPSGQLASTVVEPDSLDFQFDELGIYSPGKPALSTSGFANVDVSNKTSSDNSPLVPSSTLSLNMNVDGNSLSTTLAVPASGSGNSGEITYGDICEGINTGNWIQSGDLINNDVYVYITDDSGGSYPSIASKQSYGFLIFESKSIGTSSSVTLTCDTNDATNFFNVLTNGICGNVNISNKNGDIVGIANNTADTTLERERLLTHLIFDPIFKAADSTIKIVYTLTVSVAQTETSSTNISNV